MTDIPVVFIFFNKAETTKEVFSQIKKAAPSTLYLVSDGARLSKNGEQEKVEALRKWVEGAIDWNCQVKKIYAESNMGCKGRIVSGLTEVFNQEEYAIILEDDCRPKDSFFDYCKVLLEKYKDDPRIMLVSGNNQVAQKYYNIEYDYTFSKNVWIWGWATWARAWKLYDGEIKDWSPDSVEEVLQKNIMSKSRINEMKTLIEAVHKGKIDTWDFQWCYCVWKNDGLSIIPKFNLIDNLGFNIEEALHTTCKLPKYLKEVFFTNKQFEDKIVVRDSVERDIKFDKMYDLILAKQNRYDRNIVRRAINKIKRIMFD